ncbi:MAG: exosortase C-terminal domain/associated protein EpsI [Bryobacteraceae bacterium]
MAFLTSRSAVILSVALLAQAAVFYGGSRPEVLPPHTTLNTFPATLGKWKMIEQGVVDKETEDVLKADDLLTRVYAAPGKRPPANLFVAFFQSQRSGKSPHSPKNCLPGSGWVPSSASIISITVPTEPAPVRVNRYVVANGDQKSVVLYWYQSRGRVVASEYRAAYHTLADSMRYNRSDTALVRVVVPIVDNDAQAATSTAIDFAQSFFATLRQYLPA